MITEIHDALAKVESFLADPQKVSRVLFTGKQRNQKPPFLKINIRPVLLKSGIHWQEVSHDGKKDFTKNLAIENLDLSSYFRLGFANLLIQTGAEEASIRVTKSGKAQISISKRNCKDAISVELSHDRSKKRVLDESDPIFIALGITDHAGRLKPSRTDKFKQVQEFLKNLEAALESLNSEIEGRDVLKVVDLGCGHAYLTFAAHTFIKRMGYTVEVLGVDERTDSRDRNNEIAKNLGISSEIRFEASTIAELLVRPVDIAIALHACDTATDDALAWAIKSKARAILVAPCCQHDIQKQIDKSPEPWGIATRYGILQERIGDILTDSIRAQILRILGYQTEIIEFIAGTHTAKNLMIRAFQAKSLTRPAVRKKDLTELEAMIAQWQVKPKLMNLLHDELRRLD